MASRSTARADPLADARAVVRIAGVVVLLAALLPVHGVFAIVGSRRIPPLFLRWSARIFGARPVRIGPKPAGGGLVVANHIGWMDILVLAGTTGTAFVSKAEVRDWPLVGWLAALNRTVFVARGDRGGVATQVAALREALEREQPVAVFPEGTTGDGVTMLPFKPALFEGVAPPPRALLVHPVWIDYGAAGPAVAWPPGQGARQAAWGLMGRAGTFEARVHMLPPFDPTRYGDRKGVAAEARRRILAAAASGRGGDRLGDRP